MKRFALFAVLAVALAAVPVFAQGQDPQGRGRGMGMGMGMGPGPGGFGMGIGPMLRDLNLTDAQRQQIRSIMDDNRPAANAPRGPELEHTLLTAIANGDAAGIEQAKTALNAAHAQQLDAHIALMQKIVAVLTPEQKQQLLNAQPPQGRGRGRQ